MYRRAASQSMTPPRREGRKRVQKPRCSFDQLPGFLDLLRFLLSHLHHFRR